MIKKIILAVWGVFLLTVITGCSTSHSVTSDKSSAAIKQQPYVCIRATKPVKIDGKLDDAVWKKAEVVSKFYPYSPKDATNLPPMTARLAWDKNYLYVAIECADDDIWSYSNKDDDQLWRGDVVELFIKPSTKKLGYVEFVVAPGGALYDGRYPSRGSGTFFRFKNWSSHAKVATTINGTDGNWKDTDTGYIVEMAIPFSALKDITPPPTTGTVWTFGVCHYDYSKSFEQPLLMMSMPESKHNGYHYYEGYRPLLFQ